MTFFRRRLLHSGLVLVAVSILTFIVLDLAPGDFFEELVLNPQISPETVSRLREQYGVDRSLPVRYLYWLLSLARGEMGYSLAYNSAVGPLLFSRALNTLLLTGTALLLIWLLAVPIGVWGAGREGTWSESVIRLGISFLLAIPDLMLALLFLFFAVSSGVFPAGGMVSTGVESQGFSQRIVDLAWHMVLPVTALVLGGLPVVVRHVQAAVSEALHSPFVQAARGLGIPARRLLFGHALRAAANPLISLFGLSLAALLSGSLLIEVVMSWPGMGPFLIEAIKGRDLHVVVATVLLSTILLLGGNLLADFLLYLADPRIRPE